MGKFHLILVLFGPQDWYNFSLKTGSRYAQVPFTTQFTLRIAIKLPTDATVYFVNSLFPLFLPYMFRALISPSSGVSQAVFFYIQPFGSCGVYVDHLRVPVDWFVVVVSLYWCSTVKPPRRTI